MKFYFVSAFLISSLLFSQVSILATSNSNGTCKKTIHLKGNIERVGWGYVSETGEYTVHVLYKNGNIEEINGNRTGFCNVKPFNKRHSNLIHSLRERGVVNEKILKSRTYVDDTNANSEPGPSNDFPGWILLMNQLPVNDKKDRMKHFRSVVMTSNALGISRWYDLQSNEYFLSIGLTPFSGNKSFGAGFPIVKGHIKQGTSLAVYGYYKGRLDLLAQTNWDVRQNALDLVGAADADLNGCPEIYVIRDPEGAAVLELWELHNKPSTSGNPFTLIKKSELKEFSNRVSLDSFGEFAKFIDLDDDFLHNELIIANKSRNELKILTIRNGQMKIAKKIKLPAKISNNTARLQPILGALFKIDQKSNQYLGIPFEDNSIRAIKLPKIKKTKQSKDSKMKTTAYSCKF